MNKDDLIPFLSFFIGMAIEFLLSYAPSFFITIPTFLIMLILLVYFTSKYNLFPGRWSNPNKPTRKWQNVKGGKFLIFIIYFFIGLIVGFYIKLTFLINI